MSTHGPGYLSAVSKVLIVPFLRLAGQGLRAVVSRPDTTGCPPPRLVLRVGVTGHRSLTNVALVEPIIRKSLEDIQSAVRTINADFNATFRGDSRTTPELRIISQLAAGADQLVAGIALDLGYVIDSPIPIDRETYIGELGDAATRFAHMSANANLLQLDGELTPTTNSGAAKTISADSFENASLTVLDHCDILLALVNSDAIPRHGGSQWSFEEAERRSLPIIRIVPDNPAASEIRRGSPTNRNVCLLQCNWAEDLVRTLVLPGPGNNMPPSGRIEEKYRATVTPTLDEWLPNRLPKDVRLCSLVSDWSAAVNRDMLPAWTWAEHRANAYRNLYQGAYTAIGILAVAAVLSAYFALTPRYSTAAKWAELAWIAMMIALWTLARKGLWRQRWLGYRWLEQYLNGAAVTQLVGRAVSVGHPVTHTGLVKDGVWMEAYGRAVLRQCRLPNAKFDRDSLLEAATHVLKPKISRQVQYYDLSAHRFHRATHGLEIIALSSLAITFLVTLAYLISHQPCLSAPSSFTGLVFPALAAALAAIRAQGEFVQLENRYRSVHAHLCDIESQLDRVRLKAADSRNGSPLLSWRLARLLKHASDAMIQEVSYWRVLLVTNEIDV